MPWFIRRPFQFEGSLPASKSLLLRALVAKSFLPQLEVVGVSSCDDVTWMNRALDEMPWESSYQCGAAAAVLRFLALRLSRFDGSFLLKGEPQLWRRPHVQLTSIINALGGSAELKTIAAAGGLASEEQGLAIQSRGWTSPRSTLQIDHSSSSQFASAVLLSSWELDFPIHLRLGEELVSRSYLHMTVRLLSRLGMKIDESLHELYVPSDQRIQGSQIEIEADMSCAFAVAALGAVGGRTRIIGFPQFSWQPDYNFIDILKRMNTSIENRRGELTISKSELKATEVRLTDTPDLFPVLSVLCALAEGKSRLYGAPHLVHKESNRIKCVVELLKKMGTRFHVLEDGIEIWGPTPILSGYQESISSFGDHRIGFAVATAQAAGFDIQLEDYHAVKKSFPEFLDFGEASS